MAKFRKRPVEIDAIQLTDFNVREVYVFIYGEPIIDCLMAEDRWDDYVKSVSKEGLKLKTLESENQTQTADIGDWIIRGVKGEYYPCKPDVFELTYEGL